jgi:hypothetical protein
MSGFIFRSHSKVEGTWVVLTCRSLLFLCITPLYYPCCACTIIPIYWVNSDHRTYPPRYMPGDTRPVFRRVNPIYFHPIPRAWITLGSRSWEGPLTLLLASHVPACRPLYTKSQICKSWVRWANGWSEGYIIVNFQVHWDSGWKAPRWVMLLDSSELNHQLTRTRVDGKDVDGCFLRRAYFDDVQEWNYRYSWNLIAHVVQSLLETSQLYGHNLRLEHSL